MAWQASARGSLFESQVLFITVTFLKQINRKPSTPLTKFVCTDVTSLSLITPHVVSPSFVTIYRDIHSPLTKDADIIVTAYLHFHCRTLPERRIRISATGGKNQICKPTERDVVFENDCLVLPRKEEGFQTRKPTKVSGSLSWS
jgi:hypothetical protein